MQFDKIAFSVGEGSRIFIHVKPYYQVVLPKRSRTYLLTGIISASAP